MSAPAALPWGRPVEDDGPPSSIQINGAAAPQEADTVDEEPCTVESLGLKAGDALEVDCFGLACAHLGQCLTALSIACRAAYSPVLVAVMFAARSNLSAQAYLLNCIDHGSAGEVVLRAGGWRCAIQGTTHKNTCFRGMHSLEPSQTHITLGITSKRSGPPRQVLKR